MPKLTFMLKIAQLFKSLGAVGKKYVDIKEAPLEINNALKDETKRKIIRTLRHEKKYLTVISNDTGSPVAKVKYHLKDLERLGIVTTMQLTREKFFILTERGNWCLEAIDNYYPSGLISALRSGFRKTQLRPMPVKKIQPAE
ncbi:ArsR family transcriptional regulator [archaeon]|nr:MAG: ArsR family transcriptional regulator [archaeon]